MLELVGLGHHGEVDEDDDGVEAVHEDVEVGVLAHGEDDAPVEDGDEDGQGRDGGGHRPRELVEPGHAVSV